MLYVLKYTIVAESLTRIAQFNKHAMTVDKMIFTYVPPEVPRLHTQSAYTEK